jgi:hypothetical protein
LHNGGIVGVYRAFGIAAKRLGWHVTVRDGQGRSDLVQTPLKQQYVATPQRLLWAGSMSQKWVTCCLWNERTA